MTFIGNHPIEFLLKSISNGKIKKLSNQKDFQISNNADFSEIFNAINRYLEDCFLENGINMQKILEQNKLLTTKKGLYRVVVFSDLKKIYFYYIRN